MLNSGLTKLLGFSRETFEPGKTYTADDPHKTSHPSGDLRASCPGQYVGEPPQRSPLHTAEIYPLRERKVHVGVGVGQRNSPSCSTNGWQRGWGGGSDRDIPRLAVRTAGIGASFQADANDIRHGATEI